MTDYDRGVEDAIALLLRQGSYRGRAQQSVMPEGSALLLRARLLGQMPPTKGEQRRLDRIEANLGPPPQPQGATCHVS